METTASTPHTMNLAKEVRILPVFRREIQVGSSALLGSQVQKVRLVLPGKACLEIQ